MIKVESTELLCYFPHHYPLNLLYTGNPKTGTLTNSEDPDEILHNVAFHQVLYYLLKTN